MKTNVNNVNNLSSLALLASLASCAAVQANPGEGAKLAPTAGRWTVSAFHEDTKVDRIELNDAGRIQETARHVDRSRSGVRATYGIEYVEGYLELFSSDGLGDYSDGGGGFGIGARAEIDLHEFDNGVGLFFPYKLGVSIAGGEGNFGGMDADFGTIDVTSEIGIGVAYRGLRTSIGVTNTDLMGTLDFSGEVDAEGVDELDDIDGEFSSSYLQLAYKLPKQPIEIGLRLIGGDEEGAYINLNFLF